MGNAFYLPEVSVESAMTGGQVFFRTALLDQCVVLRGLAHSTRNFLSSHSMQEFDKQVMTDASVSGSVSVLGLSASATSNVVTQQSSTTTSAFNSTVMDIEVVTHVLNMDTMDNTSCVSLQNIDSTFLERFNSLPLISGVDTSNWNLYQQFLLRGYSHVLMEEKIGSRFRQWDSTQKDTAVAVDVLMVKVCAQVEGTGGGEGWSVASCAGYSTASKEAALKVATTSYQSILGGTKLTRANLVKNVTEQSLNAFIDSAEEGDSAITFGFRPVWEILQMLYQPLCSKNGRTSDDCKSFQRALALQAAYEGFLAIPCPTKFDDTGHKRDSNVIQAMEPDLPNAFGTFTYSCRFAKTGCRSDDDCSEYGHHNLKRGGCYCFGSSCIVQGTAMPLIQEYTDEVQHTKTGKPDQLENGSCEWVHKNTCTCSPNWNGGLPDRWPYRQSSSAHAQQTEQAISCE